MEKRIIDQTYCRLDDTDVGGPQMAYLIVYSDMCICFNTIPKGILNDKTKIERTAIINSLVEKSFETRGYMKTRHWL